MGNMGINSYDSPFSNRYGSTEMREVWSEKNKRILWHKAWLEAAFLQFDISKQGSQGALYYDEKQYKEALEEEAKTKHDLVAERNMFSKSLPKEISDKIHVGLTSSDIEDYAEEDQISQALVLVNKQIRELLGNLANFSYRYRELVVIGRTHLQAAEPTLLGYRFLWYLDEIQKSGIEGLYINKKGMHGAVGTNANLELIGSPVWEKLFKIDSPVFQTYPRQNDVAICSVLSLVASILHKLAFDIRIMAMEGLLEESKSQAQFGSSAMPGKNNPIQAEKVCGLARLFPGYYQSLWQCAANSLLERTLDDSSTRRVVIPEMFLCMSELLTTSNKLINSLKISVSPSDSQKKVVELWKSWLPSRALAIIRREGGDYRKIYSAIEYLSNTCDTPEEFLEQVWSSPILASSNNPTSIRPEVYIGLDSLMDFVGKQAKKWIDKYN
jgi:adenylosuccinate lyase